MLTYTPLPPQSVGPLGKLYLASLDSDGRKLHDMAVEKLGSSYFVEKTHGFRKWLEANKENPEVIKLRR